MRRIFGRKRIYGELAEEIRAHLDEKVEELVAGGMAREEAEHAARREFGNVMLAEERGRDVWRWPRLEDFLIDVRYALRMLRKSPGFTVVAILTLALGIGANTAVFSVVNAVLLRSLPFRNAARLVAISETHRSLPEIGASVADFRDWQSQSHSFEGLAGYDPTTLAHATLMVHGEPQEVRGAVVTHNLFPLLGIAPAMGRNFVPKEDELGKGAVAIISNELWQGRFGGNRDVLGRSVVLNDKAYTIVGILPSGIRFPEGADIWVPMGNLGSANRTNRFYHPLFAVGRLSPEVAVPEARAEMEGIAERLAKAFPRTNHGIGVNVEPLLETYVGGLRAFLFVLWAAVGLVLLIACANVAGLLLARADRREGEMALRYALGASRGRLIRQGLTESAVLAGLGGLVGLALAWAGVRFLSGWLPRELSAPILQLHGIGIDPVVLTMTLGLSVLSAVLLRILPSMRTSYGRLRSGFAAGHRVSAGLSRRRASRVMVAGEVALAVVVLISAGLLVRSSRQLVRTSPGFRVDHLLTMRLSLPGTKYNSRQAVVGFYQRLLPRLGALPGVEDVGTINRAPLVPNSAVTRFLVNGAKPVRPGDYPVANYRLVSPGYFHAMEIPLLKGRLLDRGDLSVSAPVLLVNHDLAEQFFHGRDPVGRKLLLGVASGHPTAIPIVGVVGDVRDLSIASPAPAEMYFAGYSPVSTLVIRTEVNPLSIAATVRRSVLRVDPSQPVFAVQTGEQLVDHSIARQRFSATLLAVFSMLALALAVAGIYGVTAFVVSERTHEIAVRAALGAQPCEILQMVLSQEMFAVASGVAVGIGGALVATKLFSNLLYKVTATDPMTYGGVCLMLGVAALLACYVPARRAVRVDPMTALREE